MTTEDNNSQSQRFLLVQVGNTHLALSLKNVREAIGFQDYIQVPCSEAHLLGLMSLRGTIVPLIDMAKKLKITSKSTTANEHDRGIVICTDGTNLYGLVVESIENVISLKESEILKNPKLDTTISSDFIVGVHQAGDQLALLIDSNKLLGVDDLQFIAAAPQSKEATGLKAA